MVHQQPPERNGPFDPSSVYASTWYLVLHRGLCASCLLREGYCWDCLGMAFLQHGRTGHPIRHCGGHGLLFKRRLRGFRLLPGIGCSRARPRTSRRSPRRDTRASRLRRPSQSPPNTLPSANAPNKNPAEFRPAGLRRARWRVRRGDCSGDGNGGSRDDASSARSEWIVGSIFDLA
jgi:hypothetical protein